MKHLILAILFYGITPSDAQFIPGTDFYIRNSEWCDSFNRNKTITALRNDTIFGENIFPHDIPIVWDTMYTPRFSMGYKMNISRWLLDSMAIWGSIPLSTSTLSEGTNLYYTAARFNTAFAAKTTDNLSEGTANLYFTNARSRTSVSLSTTGSGAASYNNATGALNIPNTTYTPPARSFNNTPTPTIQTVAGAANGDQLSTTRDALVSYSATIVSTATIAGNASGYMVLEICSTNSATAGSWIEISRTANGQAVSLAITLQSVSTGGGCVTGTVPAGYYRRLRSVITAGSPVFTYNSGQETLQ